MTTDDDQLSHWMEKKFQNTSQSQSCTKKKKVHLMGSERVSGLLTVVTLGRTEYRATQWEKARERRRRHGSYVSVQIPGTGELPVPSF